MNKLSEVYYLCGVLGVLVGYRIDLSVGSVGVEVCLQEGLDVVIIALGTTIRIVLLGTKFVRGLTRSTGCKERKV